MAGNTQRVQPGEARPGELRLQQESSKTTVCDCCGATSHSAWGWVHEGDDVTRCAYLAHWAESGPHPPHITLGYGAWGEGTSSDDRVSICAEKRRGKWRLVDHAAPGAPPDESTVLGLPMSAARVKRDPRGDEVRETLNFIVRNDDRLHF